VITLPFSFTFFLLDVSHIHGATLRECSMHKANDKNLYKNGSLYECVVVGFVSQAKMEALAMQRTLHETIPASG
jgi:hypothetical protein